MRLRLFCLFVSLLISSCAFAVGQKKIEISDVGSSSLQEALNSPQIIHVYFDYPGTATGPGGQFFSRQWNKGIWSMQLEIRGRADVATVLSELSSANAYNYLRTPQEKADFLGGVRVVIQVMGAQESVYYVNGCEFLEGSDLKRRALTPKLREILNISSIGGCPEDQSGRGN